MRCVIGAWNRATGDIRLFKGSTVPEATLVWASRNLGGNGGKDECNMQATGLYEYVAGSHAVTGKFPQHGVLRQPNDQNILVLRSPNNVSFDPTEATEVYDQGFFANNFHSACRKSGKPFFSAGCQIVAGSYEKENDATGFQPGTRPTGAWREFRIAIGLEEQPTAFRSDHPDKSRRFQYILLTGLEAALFASADPKFLEKYQSLRFGSRSAADGNVAQLQRELGIPPTGRFDAITAYEQVRKMNRSGSFETPILAL